MINIITGKINSGKTTKLISIYKNTNNGDGFACVKKFVDGKFVGYDIKHLRTKRIIPFAFYLDNPKKKINDNFQFGNFSFSKDGFVFAERIIDSALENETDSIFIDEIGFIEIVLEKGFYNLLKKVLNTNSNLFVTVRDEFLDEFIQKFNIRKFKKITV